MARRWYLAALLAALCGVGGLAQTIGRAHETVTFTAAAGGVGLTEATFTGATACGGTLETAAIRYAYDGTAPTSTVGHPLAVGQYLRIDGQVNLSQFRGIRTTGTSGSIYFTCEGL